VAFGAGTYAFKTATGSMACTSASFGSDPAANVTKSCYLPPVGNPVGGWAKCTSRNGACSTVAGRPVM